MILAYGGDRWCTEMIERWCGPSPTSLLSLSSDNAMDVYGGFMHEKSVVKATCEDYWHGMKTDVEAQEEDQRQGRKIKVPLLLLYSESGIGKRYDFGTVWDAWVDQGVKITRHGLGGGAGHFGPEEAPEECGKAVGEWVKGLL
jgi:pimeloyl-ACP methyl ester carboxylesterase